MLELPTRRRTESKSRPSRPTELRHDVVLQGSSCGPCLYELVDVRREAALLDFFLHLLEHQDPPVGWRVRAEEFVRAPPVALPLLLDRLPQFVRVDLAVLVEVVGVHLLPH